MVSKKDIVVPEYFTRYTNLVEENDVSQALVKNTRQFRKFLQKIPGKKINYAYAEGKWSLKEMLQHIVDAERVFSYRALTFARKDSAALPSFDENTWAITAKATKRKWNDLIDEFKALRAANELFFASLDDDQLIQTGTASNNLVNVAGLGFICAGHVIHHMKIIKERYLNGAGSATKATAGSKKEKPKAEKPKKEKLKRDKPKKKKKKK